MLSLLNCNLKPPFTNKQISRSFLTQKILTFLIPYFSECYIHTTLPLSFTKAHFPLKFSITIKSKAKITFGFYKLNSRSLNYHPHLENKNFVPTNSFPSIVRYFSTDNRVTEKFFSNTPVLNSVFKSEDSFKEQFNEKAKLGRKSTEIKDLDNTLEEEINEPTETLEDQENTQEKTYWNSEFDEFGKEKLSKEDQEEKEKLVKELSKLLSGPLVREDGSFPTGNERPTVIEVDGPSHFYANSTRYTAYTKMKHRLLTCMGYRVLHIPYFEWKVLRGNSQREEYIKNKLLEQPTQWLDKDDEIYHSQLLNQISKHSSQINTKSISQYILSQEELEQFQRENPYYDDAYRPPMLKGKATNQSVNKHKSTTRHKKNHDSRSSIDETHTGKIN